jgi:Bacterial Ig-like domain
VSDTTAPTVSAVSPANNATGVARNVSPRVTFSEAINPSTINSTTFELRNAGTNALVMATVVYDAATRRATLNPSGNLAARTRFTATVRGGATDPRVKDLAGNPLAASLTWSFTTR